MKYILIIPLIALLVNGCKKTPTDDSVIPNTNNNHLPDTGEYVTFTLQGDSFTNEIFDLVPKNGVSYQTSGNFSGSRSFFAMQIPANGYSISNYYSFTLKHAGSKSIDSLNTIAILMTNSKALYYLQSSSGTYQISHFPDSIGDFAKGSFSGQFYDQYTKRPFTITQGLFRIKRRQ